MHRPLGAQIAHMLADRGVDTVFGIPGVHNIELYRGIEQAGLTHILARHEQGAGFMADGYARATGKPGVAFVITGPGLTNIMTPMGQAYSDSVPLLVISSCLDETVMTKGQLHQMKDQRLAAETVCDWSEEARTAEAAYHLIDRAFSEFNHIRPRPKHIQVPIALAGASAPPFPVRREIPYHGIDNPIMRNVVAKRINAARRPLFIFGGGARHLIFDNEIADLLRLTRAACFTTYAGRGAVSPDYPLNFGSYLARPGSADIIGSADLVVAVGTELSETDLWRHDTGHAGPLIRIDIDPEGLADRHCAEIAVQAEAELFLFNMMPLIEDRGGNSGWSANEVAEARRKWRAEVISERPGIVPVCDALRACLPEGTVIFSDMTQFAYTAKEVWDLAAPGLWHHPFGFGTLGYALPAAIGGKVGVAAKPVVAIAGDYGFQYTMQELGTAAELGLGLPILIWDNGMLKEIEASMQRSQIAPIAVQAQNPDFGKLAAAYGIEYACPSSLPDLQSAVTDALSANGPTLIRMTPALTD